MNQMNFRAPSVADVRIVDDFWSPRQVATRMATVPVFYERCREAGILDHIDPDIAVKPRLALNGVHGQTAQRFWDSDVGKLVEMAGYVLVGARDPELEAKIDALVDKLGRMQQPDGYLNSWFTYQEKGKRWTNLRDDHELYSAGHLIEGAVAYFEATGKRKLLDIMCRYVDHIATVFGTGPGQKRGYCGHEEIELALVRLYHVTGKRKHLELARYFIDERGRQPHYFDEEARARDVDPAKYYFGSYEYGQAHIPVREQNKVVGHAVRAMYLYSGMADIAAEYGDLSLKAACDRLWDDLMRKRLYVTGGLGPSARNEGFTSDYDLPNETAYAETCAAVGLVFWANRMLRIDLDRRYGDAMEVALFNGALGGVSLDGSLFYYENPLASRGAHLRWKWHRCPCCPPNIGRLIASLGRYAYGVAADALAVHLYVGSDLRCTLSGTNVRIAQQTRYPWDGAVSIEVEPETPTSFGLHLRIPGWCKAPSLRVNGQQIDLGSVEKGYVRIEREWKKGDRVELDLPMIVERIHAHPDIREDAGRVALKRGPLVYCAEACDNAQPVYAMTLPADASLAPNFDAQLLGGVVTLRAEAMADAVGEASGSLYRFAPPPRQKAELRAIPYYAWGHRAPGAMQVWLRGD
ncbi:MAG TPA: beta-L-arabinofuranosidase domain-containing protein [Magnetospirillaceae bacterium]|jgi:hypothetical protein